MTPLAMGRQAWTESSVPPQHDPGKSSESLGGEQPGLNITGGFCCYLLINSRWPKAPKMSGQQAKLCTEMFLICAKARFVNATGVNFKLF
jgi:hypothetical protein